MLADRTYISCDWPALSKDKFYDEKLAEVSAGFYVPSFANKAMK
jgi:hypothetical protein